MNGIITFDDGAGTVIEDGTVITDNFSTTSFECDTIATGEITSKVLANPINICATTTGTITLGSSGQINLGNSISITDKTIASPAVTDTINLFDNITTGTVNMCKMDFKQNSISSNAVTDIVSLFDNITTGTVNMCKMDFKQNSIASSAVTDAVSLFDNITTGSVNIAKTIFKQNSIASSAVTDTVSLFNNITTGTVNMCNNSIKLSEDSITSASATDVINLYNNITTGTVSMAKFVFSQNAIKSTASNDTVSLFENITTGNIQLMENVTGGSLTIGNAVATTGNGGAINIGVGQRNKTVMGNATTSGTGVNSGIVAIRKIQIGENVGTAYRCMIMGSTGAGLSGSQLFSIPGAPTTLGTPIVFANINVDQTNDTGVYVVNTIVASTTQFRYRKRFISSGGGAVNDATSESINYVAYWL
jgi:hypothetical protein